MEHFFPQKKELKRELKVSEQKSKKRCKYKVAILPLNLAFQLIKAGMLLIKLVE